MEKKVTLELNVADVYQLHLCVISRNAYAHQKWASACSEEEQKQMQAEIDYLTGLTNMLVGVLNNAEAEANANNEQPSNDK